MKYLIYSIGISLAVTILSFDVSAQGDNPNDPTIISIGNHQVVNCTSAPSAIGVTITPWHPGYQFLWSTGETDSAITVQPSQSTSYYLQIDNAALGISMVKGFQLDVINEPILVETTLYNVDKHTCPGTPLEIEPSFTGGHAPYTLTWPDNSTARTKIIEPHSSTIQEVLITDACGTSEIANIQIELETHDPIIAQSSQVINFDCKGELISLEPNLNSLSGGVGYGYSYTFDDWADANQPIEVVAEDQMEIEVGFGDACKNEIIKHQILLEKNPIVVPTATDEIVCAGSEVELTEETDIGRLYYWDGRTMNVEYAAPIDQSETFDLTYLDRCGDKHTVEKKIAVSEVEADFEFDVHANQNRVEFKGVTNESGSTYNWIINGKNAGGNPEFEAELEQGTTNEVTLEITNQYGCKRGVTKAVHVKDNLSIPTAFSPNGDGHNDYFFIAFDEPFHNFQVEIFDRWGQRIFHSSDQYFRWEGDAEHRGELNNYVYMIKGITTAGKVINETGTLTVVN